MSRDRKKEGKEGKKEGWKGGRENKKWNSVSGVERRAGGEKMNCFPPFD